MTISRRNFARGTAWAAPTLVVAAAAPAMAQSPCGGIVAGQPLPASAFTLVYLDITTTSFGDLITPKQFSVIAGIKINPLMQACVGANQITMSSTTSKGSATLTNNTTYTLANGVEGTGSGTTGTPGGCGGGDGSAQVCITSTSLQLNGATSTTSYNPKAMSLIQSVYVAGYGTTVLTLNAASYVKSGNWIGGGLSIS